MMCQKIHMNTENEYVKDKRNSSVTYSCSSTEELLSKTKLNIILTNRGLQIYGTWSKTKFLELLANKLKQCIQSQISSTKLRTEIVNEKRLWVTIHSGLYNMYVLRTLQKNGMSMYTIAKAMKLGLISLNSCELSYFKCFRVDSYILEFKDMWIDKLSYELISNLRTTGLKELDCWHIIIHGVELQSSYMLCHLLFSGIDIPGILNWQSSLKQASHKIPKFLNYIGVEEEVIELVEQYGINEEIEQMLTDIGLNQFKEECSHEIICECVLTILESDTCNLQIMNSLSKMTESDSISTACDVSDHLQRDCQCYLTVGRKTTEEQIVQRNDYLRQNVMVPIAWAMARTLKYKPSDPLHYLAYELFHWKHGNINQQKKESIKESIALATVAMDRKLILRKHMEQKKLIKDQNEEAMKNIPCIICKKRQELHRIKEACWKCVTKPITKQEPCEFPEVCSSCKMEVLSKKLESCQLSQYCSSCKIDNASLNKFEACQQFYA